MPYLYILAAVVLRVIPHPWNLSPMGAMFLFSGGTFRSKLQAMLVPLAALLISDYAVIQILYHGRFGWFSPWNWSAFALVGLIGWTLRGRITVGRVAAASLAGSTAFFVVSNFGVWAGGKLYPMTAAGLGACYVAALPFFGNTIAGDLLFSALMFGSYYWLRQRHVATARA